jgi:hypothetical protein
MLTAWGSLCVHSGTPIDGFLDHFHLTRRRPSTAADSSRLGARQKIDSGAIGIIVLSCARAFFASGSERRHANKRGHARMQNV